MDAADRQWCKTAADIVAQSGPEARVVVVELRSLSKDAFNRLPGEAVRLRTIQVEQRNVVIWRKDVMRGRGIYINATYREES